MKATKKILAAFLSLAMILGSIYWVDMAGSEAKAEATANTDMLEVKVQVATDDSNVIRFVSSVDSLEYKEVGFEVTPNGETTKTYTTKTVYERIKSEEEGVEYKFSPKVVDTSSEYFVTAKLRATAGVDYVVRAFVTTLEDEKVYGATRCVAVEDGKSTSTLNLTYEAATAPTVGNTIDVTYGASSTATTAEVIYVDGSDVTVRVSVNPKTLPSATKFTFGTTGSTIYRNYYTTHVKVAGDTTQINADTTWYTVDTSAKEFVVATTADLYGLATYNEGYYTWNGKTIYLVSDLEFNPTTTGTTAKAWADASTTPSGVYEWTPIGAETSWKDCFRGTFDGQMHTISGLYSTTATKYSGFFGLTAVGGTVKNFYIKESYFKSTSVPAGSAVGKHQGVLENVYSNAIIQTSTNYAGGMTGWCAGTPTSITNCWFDGEIRAGVSKYIGGIAGYTDHYAENCKFENNLFTGKITHQNTGSNLAIGGIVGGSYIKPISITNCLSAGEITGTSTSGVGSIYGYSTVVATLMNIYGTTESGNVLANGTNLSGITTGTALGLANADLKGTAGYQKTLLDFEDTWVARKDDVPALMVFEDVIGEVASLADVEQDQWYYSAFPKFGIGSASALQSIASYVNAAESRIDFKDKTLCLYEDIEVNEVEEGTLAAWKAGTGTLPESWIPIGDTEANYFAGIFDGQMYTISGVYMKRPATCTSYQGGHGLFGKIGYYGRVKNFYLMDSYFEVNDPNGASNNPWTNANLGSVVGNNGGQIDTVYSNATVVSNRYQVGGIAGYSGGGGIKNCWYDGDIFLDTAHGRTGGGIIGHAGNAETFENLLFTGSITYTNGYYAASSIGGIMGATYNAWKHTLTFKNCISAGTLTKTDKTTYVGSVVGQVADYNGVVFENVYASTDFFETTHTLMSSNATESGKITSLTEAQLYGDLATTNAAALDYTNTWVVREGDVPALKVFTKVIGQ